MAWEREIEVCRDVARRAGELALRHAAKGVEREDKADDSPVTVADRECERLIVSELRAAFPEDGFLGEEGASDAGRSGRRWIVDPIDGTRDFLRGLPTWSNLIGLEVDGEVVLGTCNMAAQGELYWAVRGQGAFVNGRRVRVSTIDRRDRAIACLTAFDNIAASPFADRILDYLAGYWAVRSMGGCQDAVLVVSGRAEAWFEISAKAWDLAPLKVLAEEAGARFFNFDGGSSIRGGNAVICAPFLEEELRAFVEAPGARLRIRSSPGEIDAPRNDKSGRGPVRQSACVGGASMPELPDLLYILSHLRERLLGRQVTAERVREPVVLRFTVRGNLSLLLGRKLADAFRKSHFLVFRFEGLDLAVNPMLAGRFRLAEPGTPDEASLGFALGFGDVELRYLDDKKMGKAYLITTDDWKAIPGLQTGGIDLLSPEFSRERFVSLLKHRRDQVRVFLLDKKALDSLGNAYADEVLFEAGIHPKTFCRSLGHDDGVRLHDAIVKVMNEAVAEVASRGEPIDVKVRDFLKVRRKDTCPRCARSSAPPGSRAWTRGSARPASPRPARASWTGRAPASERIIPSWRIAGQRRLAAPEESGWPRTI